MKIVWDESKRLSTLADRGLDFADAEACDWDAALIVPSYPGPRGEARFRATVPLGGTLLSIVFSPLGSEAITIISMRPASRRERRQYAEAT